MFPSVAAGAWLIALALFLGFFSLSKYALLSASKLRLREWAGQGNQRAEFALKIAESPVPYLSTARVGTILAAALIGLQTGLIYVEVGRRYLELPPFSSGLGSSLAYLIMFSVLSLITALLGEILPRQIAMSRPEWVLVQIAKPIYFLALVGYPVAWPIGLATQLVLRGLGIGPDPLPPDLGEKLKELLEQATQADILNRSEQQLIERVVRYCDRKAKAIMTPRDQIVWIDVRDSPEEIKECLLQSSYSRFPVCDQSLDNLIGVIDAKKLLASNATGESPIVKGSLGIPLFLYEGTRGSRIIDMFRNSASPFAIVLDEYGSVTGILTLTDILQALVGDLSDKDEEDSLLEARLTARGARVLDGRLPIDEFASSFELSNMPKEDFDTLGGFVVMRFGRIPKAGDHFVWQGLRFEVLRMVGNRVGKVSVLQEMTDTL